MNSKSAPPTSRPRRPLRDACPDLRGVTSYDGGVPKIHARRFLLSLPSWPFVKFADEIQRAPSIPSKCTKDSIVHFECILNPQHNPLKNHRLQKLDPTNCTEKIFNSGAFWFPLKSPGVPKDLVEGPYRKNFRSPSLSWERTKMKKLISGALWCGLVRSGAPWTSLSSRSSRETFLKIENNCKKRQKTAIVYVPAVQCFRSIACLPLRPSCDALLNPSPCNPN